MYYCNDLYSLSILSLFEGELLGQVDKLYFDKKLKKLIHIELLGEDGAKLILPAKNIYHVGKNAITVKNKQAVLLNNNECEISSAPISFKAYSINGEFLGVVKEIRINEKFYTDKIVLDNDMLLNVDNIVSCGKNTIVFNLQSKKISTKQLTPNKTPEMCKSLEVQTVETMPTEEVKSNAVLIEKVDVANFQNSDFLIGRTCTKDIFNFNNELLIKAYTTVNKKVLKEINKFGKLRELMLYTR